MDPPNSISIQCISQAVFCTFSFTIWTIYNVSLPILTVHSDGTRRKFSVWCPADHFGFLMNVSDWNPADHFIMKKGREKKSL